MYNHPDESLRIKTKRPFWSSAEMPNIICPIMTLNCRKVIIMMYTIIVANGENVRMVKVEADNTKAARAMVELAKGEKIFSVKYESEHTPRGTATCKVTYVTVDRDKNNMFVLNRATKVVHGTAGQGKNAERDVKLFAKKANDEFPKGCLIESIVKIAD